MNIDFIKTMLGSADRIKELLARRDAIGAEQAKLAEECAEIDTELQQLTGQTPTALTTRAPQKCGICGKEGHSRRTCPDKPTE